MKIRSIKAVEVDVTPQMKTKPRVPQIETGGFVSPMARYPELSRADWGNPWKRTACVVTAEDGTWGFGLTLHSGVTVPLINDHLAPLIEGENCMATERVWDLMQKAASPYGIAGVTSFAISAVDNALWDLKGKLLGRPVYELIGGPQKDKIFCYASNTDISYGTENSIEFSVPYEMSVLLA